MIFFLQISPSVVEATCIKNIKPDYQNHCKKELIKAPKDKILLRNDDSVGMLKPGLNIHKTSERKSSEPPSIPMSALEAYLTSQVEPSGQFAVPAAKTVKISSQSFKANCSTVKAVNQAVNPVKIHASSRVRIVAQMPKETRTPSQEISSLLKPLRFDN